MVLLTATGGAGEFGIGEETGMHVGEGDEHEERVVLVIFDEVEGVGGEELGKTTVLVRLRQQSGVVVQVAGIAAREIGMELRVQMKKRVNRE